MEREREEKEQEQGRRRICDCEGRRKGRKEEVNLTWPFSSLLSSPLIFVRLAEFSRKGARIGGGSGGGWMDG